MEKLEKNDWHILNNIIYKIHTTDRFDDMRISLLEQLKMVIDFDSAIFYLASKEKSRLLGSPVTCNCDCDLAEMFEKTDYIRKIMDSGKTLVFRETDIISDEERVETDFYKNCYKENNWHYALQLVVCKQNKLLGTIVLYRTIGKENYTCDDIQILDYLKDHLAYRMDRYISGAEISAEKITISEAIKRYELSKRESTVLKELMMGKDNNSICEELFITTNTLKKHILNIYRKLGIRNRVQLFKMIKENE